MSAPSRGAAGNSDRDQWRELTSSLSIGAVVHDQASNALFVNPTALRILGHRTGSSGRKLDAGYWTPIDIQGRPVPRARHPVTLSLADAVSRDVVPLGVTRPDGEVVWISLRTSVLEQPGGRRVLATFSDVSMALAVAGGQVSLGPTVEGLLDDLAKRFRQPSALVAELETGTLVVEAVGHPDRELALRWRADLIGQPLRVPPGSVRTSHGILASSARPSRRRFRPALAAPIRDLFDQVADREWVYLDLPGPPRRAWLALARPPAEPALALTDMLELRRAALQIAARLRLLEPRGREASASQWIQLLARIERTMASSVDLEFALDNSLRLLVEGLGLHAGAIWLRIAPGSEPACAAATGFQRYDMRSESRRGRILEPVLRGGTPITSHRLGSEAMVRTELAEVEGFVFYHAVSMKMRTRTLGALELFHRHSFEPDRDWTEFVRLAAGCLAGTVAAWARLAPPAEARRTIPAELTAAQRRVLGLALGGSDVDAMAAALHLSPHTIKYHLANLYRRLGVADRIELLAKAGRENWL